MNHLKIVAVDVVWFCLCSFVFTICPRVLSGHLFPTFSVVFLPLVIIGRCVFLVWLLSSFLLFCKLLFNFFMFNNFFYFNKFILFYLFSFFFLPFLLSDVADRALVCRPGVRPVSLRLLSWVQETSRIHVISNGERSPRDLHLNAKTQVHSITSKLRCWTPYAKQLARQEQNTTH